MTEDERHVRFCFDRVSISFFAVVEDLIFFTGRGEMEWNGLGHAGGLASGRERQADEAAQYDLMFASTYQYLDHRSWLHRAAGFKSQGLYARLLPRRKDGLIFVRV